MTEYREPAATEPPVDLPVPARALTIGAHPDDAEFGAGGTLAKWAAAGSEVTMLIMTDGSKGTWDPALPTELLVTARRAEQAAAAEALGAGQVVMLDHVDGELEATMAVRAELAWWIRSVRPDVVLTHDPWRRYMFHPDHRAAGMAAIDGVVAARDHLFFPEQLGNGLEQHRPDALLLWAPDEPNHWERIEGFVDTKVDALLCHSSQGTTTMNGAEQSEEAAAEFRAEIRERAAGAAAGHPAAEAFRLMVP